MSFVPFESQRGWLRRIRARAIEVFEKTPENGYPKEDYFCLTVLARAMREEYTTFKRETGTDVDNARPRTDLPPKSVLYLRDLSRQEIEKLPTEDQTCHICYDHFLSGKTLKPAMQLECGHKFCETCIAEWFCSPNPPNTSCPMCRAEMSGLRSGRPLSWHQWYNLPEDVTEAIWEIRSILKTTGRPIASDESHPVTARLVAMDSSRDNRWRFSHHSEITVSATAVLEYVSGKWTRYVEDMTPETPPKFDGTLRLKYQIRALKLRLQPVLDALGTKTLWDIRSFGLMDLYPTRLPLVKDFLEQLVEAEQYQERWEDFGESAAK